MYPIKNFTSFTSSSDIQTEERRSVINEARFLLPDDMSNENRKFIVNILLELSQEERKPLIDHTLELITDKISAEERKDLISTLSKIPQEERRSIIDEASRLIIENVSNESKLFIVSSLSRIPQEERKTIIDQILRLFNGDKSAQSINVIFHLIFDLSAENISLLTMQALRLITDEMPALHKEVLIEFLRGVPIDKIEFLTTQALRLITDTMCALDRIKIISCLTGVPLENMQSVITEAVRLITNDMTSQDIEEIISYILTWSENEREFLIMHVLHLSAEDITGEDRMGIINRIFEGLDEYKFVTSSDQISNNPIKVVVDLYQFLDRKYIGLLPYSIKYTNSEGVDDGGLTRSFVATLTDSFCNPKYGFVINTEIGVIPIFGENESSQDQEKCFKTMGRFFSSAIQEYKSIVVGQYFHPIVFEMIFNLTAEDLINYDSSEVFDKMLKISIVKELNAPEEMAEALVQNNITDELREIYALDSKEECVKEYNFDEKIKAILIIAKSMYDSLLNKVEWDSLKGNSANSLRERIQGVISRDTVKSALQIDKMDEADETSFKYIKKWITGTNSEMLEKLIEAISGMKTLNSTTKLNIAGVNGLDKLPEFHTCFFRMDLSRYSSYEAFKEKLEISLSYCFSGSGFQMV